MRIRNLCFALVGALAITMGAPAFAGEAEKAEPAAAEDTMPCGRDASECCATCQQAEKPAAAEEKPAAAEKAEKAATGGCPCQRAAQQGS